MSRDTYNFEFYPADENDWETPVRLSFDIEEGAHLSKIHTACKAFAFALGYAAESVEKMFGPDTYEV